MDPQFWHDRWHNNQNGFHEGETNVMLRTHFRALGLMPGARILVPLCGKTRDIAWLLTQGHPVIGAELSRLAVEQLFAELGAEPTITDEGDLIRFSAEGVDILVGDVFDLTAESIGNVPARAVCS